MRIISLRLSQITFETKEYNESLKESVLRRGLAFPLKIKVIDNQYVCEDGHKRLTILSELSKVDSNHKYVNNIPVILVNTNNKRSNDCWRDRNAH